MKLSDLKPYFVFIAPPNIDKLKQMRQSQGVKLSVSTRSGIISCVFNVRGHAESLGP